jgi:hypothetical protein
MYPVVEFLGYNLGCVIYTKAVKKCLILLRQALDIRQKSLLLHVRHGLICYLTGYPRGGRAHISFLGNIALVLGPETYPYAVRLGSIPLG